MSATAPHPSRTPPVSATTGRTLRTGMTSLAVALAANLVILAVARLLGADMTVHRPGAGSPMTIGIGPVTVATVLPVLIATLLLLPLRRRVARAWRPMAYAGLVVGLLSVVLPFTVVAEGDTRTSLAAMHVVTGLVWFVVVGRAAARPGEV